MPKSRKTKDSKEASPPDRGLMMRTLGPRDPESMSAHTGGAPVAGSSSDRPERHPDSRSKVNFRTTLEERQKWWTCVYNPETKAFLGRTSKSWLYIISYAVLYLLFLSSYTMLFLYLSLIIVKNTEVFDVERIFMSTYAENGIGLSATPTAVHSMGNLIWYQKGDQKQIEPYVRALDDLLQNNKARRKRQASVEHLGSCGSPPYGYGDSPCVVFRINKLLGWSAKALTPDSPLAKDAPAEVKTWVASKQMLWFHCGGYYPWVKDHLGEIKYYPDPPGIDPSFYPQNMSSPSPLVAAQFKRFTLGISLVIECKLWHDTGTSSIGFVLYVAPSQEFYLRANKNLLNVDRL